MLFKWAWKRREAEGLDSGRQRGSFPGPGARPLINAINAIHAAQASQPRGAAGHQHSRPAAVETLRSALLAPQPAALLLAVPCPPAARPIAPQCPTRPSNARPVVSSQAASRARTTTPLPARRHVLPSLRRSCGRLFRPAGEHARPGSDASSAPDLPANVLCLGCALHSLLRGRPLQPSDRCHEL